MTLQITASEIELDEKITKPEAAAHSEDDFRHRWRQEREFHWYDTDIYHLIQAAIAAQGVTTQANNQSMITEDIIEYYANHLFQELCQQSDAAIQDFLQQSSIKITNQLVSTSMPLPLEPSKHNER